MSPRILITAFEPYDSWAENSSWLALVEFTKSGRRDAQIVTRRYPVDFDLVRARLEEDLAIGFDYALHLGQSPGASRIELEAIGLNVGGRLHEPLENCHCLVADGPVAYRSQLPLAHWAEELRQAGIPASVSYHAGTYLCNATLYLTHHIAATRGLATKAAFVHLPLDVSQVVRSPSRTASLSAETSARALERMVSALATRAPAPSLV
jgi:pyroglutamyl-peptidase